MTSYIIFLFIYPLLNKLLEIIDQKQLLRIVLFSATLRIVIGVLTKDIFFPSILITWTSIYFLMAYLKNYCGHTMQSLKVRIVTLGIGILGYIAQVVVTNSTGLPWLNTFYDDVIRWNGNNNPFYIFFAISCQLSSVRYIRQRYSTQ